MGCHLLVLVFFFALHHQPIKAGRTILSDREHQHGLRSSPLAQMLAPNEGVLSGLPDKDGHSPPMTDNGAAETAQQFLQPSDKADSAVDTSVDDTSASDDTSDNTHDTDQADAADDTYDADARADTHVALDTRFHRAGGLVQKFDHAKGIFDFIPFSQSWRTKCKEIAHERSQPYLPNINKDEGEKFEDSLEQMADTLENQPSDMPARPSPMVRQNAQVGLSGNLERQNAMHKLSIVAGNVPPMKKRTKILQSLNNFGQQLVPAMKKRFDDFKYVLRCKPWKTLKVSIGVGLVVAGAVFPAAGAGIAVAGLVWAAVNAVMDAADEPCLGGAGYVFVRTAVVQTGLALVGIPVDGAVPAQELWGATDQTLLILGQVGGYVDILAAAEEEFHTFKCSCGTVENGNCEPTEGPTNPLNRLKEKAKEMFPQTAALVSEIH